MVIQLAGGGGIAGKSFSELDIDQRTAGVYIDDKFVYPTRDKDGEEAARTWATVNSTDAWLRLYSPFALFRKIEFPAHYKFDTAARSLFRNSYADMRKFCAAEEFVVKSKLDAYYCAQSIEQWSFKKVEFDAQHNLRADGTYQRAWFQAGTVYNRYPRPEVVEISLPNLEDYCSKYLFWSASMSGTPTELKVYAPKLKNFVEEGGVIAPGMSIAHWKGNNVLPSCVKHGNLDVPTTADQTWRFPNIETVVDAMLYNHTGTGTLHLYWGPHLQSVADINNLVTYAANVDIHIPPGNTTTKTTLDTAGVAYTQDYEYWEDLPEEA